MVYSVFAKLIMIPICFSSIFPTTCDICPFIVTSIQSHGNAVSYFNFWLFKNSMVAFLLYSTKKETCQSYRFRVYIFTDFFSFTNKPIDHSLWWTGLVKISNRSAFRNFNKIQISWFASWNVKGCFFYFFIILIYFFFHKYSFPWSFISILS